MSRPKKNTSPSGQAQRGETAQRPAASDRSKSTTDSERPMRIRSHVVLARYALGLLRGSESQPPPVFVNGQWEVWDPATMRFVRRSREWVYRKALIPLDGLEVAPGSSNLFNYTKAKGDAIFATMCILAAPVDDVLSRTSVAEPPPPSTADKETAHRRFIDLYTTRLTWDADRSLWTPVPVLHEGYKSWLRGCGAEALVVESPRQFGKLLSKAGAPSKKVGHGGQRRAPLQLTLPGIDDDESR